ncbi:MAG: UbiA-like polyprenyltransferase, partial [Armatimonadota bacterium]
MKVESVAFRESKLVRLLNLVKFQHTVFALPFALMSAFVCADGWPTWRQLLLILLCMVSARTAAMSFNRIADWELDGRNPRTRDRELPRGEVRMWEAQVLTVVSAAIFVLAAHGLNELCFWLSYPALFIILSYSYTKRFTSWTHGVLGLSLSIAPVGAWIAVSGTFALAPFALAAAVALWVAGFDIIYATLDYEFDKRERLHSAVRRLGVARALRLSALLHVGFFAALLAFGYIARLGAPYYAGATFVGVFLLYEHSIIRPTDLRRVNAAFFAVNGIISLVLL